MAGEECEAMKETLDKLSEIILHRKVNSALPLEKTKEIEIMQTAKWLLS
jgi:hypothetical protein